MFRNLEIDEYGDKRTRRMIFASMWAASAAVSAIVIYVAYFVY